MRAAVFAAVVLGVSRLVEAFPAVPSGLVDVRGPGDPLNGQSPLLTDIEPVLPEDDLSTIYAPGDSVCRNTSIVGIPTTSIDNLEKRGLLDWARYLRRKKLFEYTIQPQPDEFFEREILLEPAKKYIFVVKANVKFYMFFSVPDAAGILEIAKVEIGAATKTPTETRKRSIKIISHDSRESVRWSARFLAGDSNNRATVGLYVEDSPPGELVSTKPVWRAGTTDGIEILV